MISHFSAPLCKNLTDIMGTFKFVTTDKFVTTENISDDLLLQNLCFFENPTITLENMYKFTQAIQNGKKVVITDDVCKDLAPYIIMDIIARGLGVEKPNLKIPSSSIHKMIKHLRLPLLSEVCDDVDSEDIWPFPIAYGRSHNRDVLERSIKKEIWNAVEGLMKTLKEWLSTQGFKMVGDFEYEMENLLLELIENSDHSLTGMEDDSGGDWAITGYMARRANGEVKGNNFSYVCYLTMVTMGNTIYDSLSKTTNPVARKYLDEYITHAPKHEKLSEECLMTAAATHDSISSREAGGNGLTDFLHRFSTVTAAEHLDKRSFVISGRGHVHFFGDYSSTVESALKRIRQPFNPFNSTKEPPDTNHVFTAEHSFPGTIVGMRFYLDQGDLIARYQQP